ncbi:MAG: hypothetical protein F9K40_05580 [Kofleriaceae bacterium]|nr:MAG: hypothetical protein F9K40_05580 [Kofleriaceae bacterium]MBZ0234158.1 hypothetical protein [Kofleriaceae bacterium]
MTSFVRTSFASLSTTCAFAALLALGACGGDDDGVTIVDAAPDAEIDAPIDAPPLVCNAPTMNCGGQCVNTTNDEQFCGNCNTQCPAGQICTTSSCACPTMDVPTTITAPSNSGGFGIELQETLQLNTSTISGDALLIGIDPTMTTEGMEYTFSEQTLGTVPAVGWGINFQVDIQNQSFNVDASFAAIEGTVTFTKVCPDMSGGSGFPNGGVMGTLSNVKFAAVDGLLTGTPTIVEGGCTLPATGTYETISFTIGNVTCSAAAQ